MIATESQENGKTARELLRFLDELMCSLARVDLGEPGVAQLTLAEMRILAALAEAGRALSIDELAALSDSSAGEAGQAATHLRHRRLAERVGGGRGQERSFAITLRGRQVLRSVADARSKAVEAFIAQLNDAQRLRLEGAVHLLGRDLDRLSEGMLAA
jgi:hypothetical protein